MGEEYLDYLVTDLEYSNLYLLFLKIKKDNKRGLFADIYPKLNDINKLRRKNLEDNKEISNTLDLFVKEIYEYEWEERKTVGLDSKVQAHEVHITTSTKKGKYIFIFLAIYNYRILCNYFPYNEYKNIKGDYLIPQPDGIDIEDFSGEYEDKFIINSYKAFLSYCEINNHSVNKGVNVPFYNNFTRLLNILGGLDSIFVNKEMFAIKDDLNHGRYTFIIYNDLIFLTHYEDEIKEEVIKDDNGNGCVFCGDTTYGDIVCPSCANNID